MALKAAAVEVGEEQEAVGAEGHGVVMEPMEEEVMEMITNLVTNHYGGNH